jgi:hypothetical protein
VSAVGDKLKETDRMKIYKSKRLCDHHFDPSDKMSVDRIKPSAIPSVNLHRKYNLILTFIWCKEITMVNSYPNSLENIRVASLLFSTSNTGKGSTCIEMFRMPNIYLAV